MGEVAGEGSPLQLYYTPEQQAQMLAEQQRQQYAAPAQQAPVRYVYVPGTALVNTPYGQRYIRYYQPEAVMAEPPAQSQELAAAALPSGVPTKTALQTKRAKEITALRQALNNAEMREKKYEKKVHDLKSKSIQAAQKAQVAQNGMVTAKNLQNWAKMEKAAALRLANVEKMAEARVQKQNAAVQKLLPIVRQEVSRRRVLERRLAKAAFNARMSSQQEMLERQRLMEDIQIAEQAEQHARVATLSYKTMQKRAQAMTAQAAADRVQAKKDIQDARASVIGARTSAAKTLAAIRAVMGGKKTGKASTIDSVQEEKFATAARDATKEMGSKKRAAKALRKEAHRLDSQSRQLSLTAAQWEQQIPEALARAHATEAEAQRLRATLKATVVSSLPVDNRVQNAQQLTQINNGQGKMFIHRLAQSEQQHQQAAALLARVSNVARQESLKATRDQVLARRKMALAMRNFQQAKKDTAEYENKVHGLENVLKDSKQELAELETEAKDISSGPEY